MKVIGLPPSPEYMFVSFVITKWKMKKVKMKRLVNNIYFRELMCRQNKSITEAQIHNYIHAKRYSNEEIGECFKEMKQFDLGGKPAGKNKDRILTEIETLKNKLRDKEEELENIKELNFDNIKDGSEIERKLEGKFIERLFIYNHRLVIVDDKQKLMIRYKSDLFDEQIIEFTKIYNWLDNRGAYLKFTDDSEREHVIDKTEIATVIHFFSKLNKIKKDQTW